MSGVRKGSSRVAYGPSTQFHGEKGRYEPENYSESELVIREITSFRTSTFSFSFSLPM